MRRLPWLCLVLCVSVAPAVWAQNAELSGLVRDSSAAAIPNATLKIVSHETGTSRTTKTNDSGLYSIPALKPGTYDVDVSAEGFKKLTRSDLKLEVGQRALVDFTLEVGSLQEVVTVRGGEPVVNMTDGSVSTVVDRNFAENLPLNGRSFQSLITLTPGALLTKASGPNPGQFTVNGQRPDSNYFTVDGVSANFGVGSGVGLQQTGGGALPGLAATGGTNNLVSVDALQEFKIQTSTFAPEFGRTPGAQVQIVTRSGTNDFHGTLFDYFRNDALDANDWFGNANRQSKPPERHNHFGGVFSGPVLLPRFGARGRQPWYNGRNRTFFFFSYEGLRLRQPTVSIASVPSQSVRKSAPTQLRAFLNAYPVPNGPDLVGTNGSPNGLAQYAASYSNPSRFDATSVRIDHIISDRLTLFGRYNYSPSESAVRQTTPSDIRTAAVKTHTVTAGLNWTLSTSLNNDFRANYSRNGLRDGFTVDGLGGANSLDLSSVLPSSVSPQNGDFSLLITGTGSLFVGPLSDNLQRQLNLVDNLSAASGVHQMKFGIDYRRLTPISRPRTYFQGITFSSIGLTAPGVTPPAGTIFSGQASAVTVLSNTTVELLFNEFSAYGQDTWKVTRRMTLTYGLRWEVSTPPKGRNGNDLFTVQGLDNLSTLTIAPRGTPLYRTKYNNFAPRVGLAYRLSKKQNLETVVRGGFGVFYDLGTGVLSNAAASFPYNKSIFLTPPPVAFPLTPAQAAPPPINLDAPYGTVQGVADPNLKLPRILQWNFAVEQSLGAKQSGSVTYVGAAGRRLLVSELLGGTGLSPNFTSVIITRNAATSDYNALQIQFNRRLSRGLQALASYTWSHSIDSASDDVFLNPPGEKIDPQQNRGSSDFDVRHSFSAAVTYNIPPPGARAVVKSILRNWFIDTIFAARSATPVSVISTRNIGFGLISLRPDLVPGVPLYIDDVAVGGGRRINRAAFEIPTALRQGTLGRNSLRGFSFWELDLSLRRQISLSERLMLQLRAEFFNIFNHPNFADPQNNLTSATFGQSTTMFGRSLASGTLGGLNPLYQVGGPRSIQLSMKLNF